MVVLEAYEERAVLVELLMLEVLSDKRVQLPTLI